MVYENIKQNIQNETIKNNNIYYAFFGGSMKYHIIAATCGVISIRILYDFPLSYTIMVYHINIAR